MDEKNIDKKKRKNREKKEWKNKTSRKIIYEKKRNEL